MTKTRDNHYVPQWYQRLFIEPGGEKLAYLDMKPTRHVRGDGQKIIGRSTFRSPTARCFFQTDLYSTFFGTKVSDEIERKLFGVVDDRGSNAVRAYLGTDRAAWHDHFQALFEFIDAQKLRTPKGLDWLRAQYPSLNQNELMEEMQGLRQIHCTIWAQGVREIVSAEDAEVKFLVSDHPVTIYNHAVPPAAPLCVYPGDPGIALKASQTLFPLSRDFCLILTNLEYAMHPACAPLEKRTFARNFKKSMVSSINFVRNRKLTGREVSQINHVLKSRARRFVAAGREEWLFPEANVTEPWAEMRDTLLPKDDLWQFGGEIYAKFDDGRVYYQDEFGRTEKVREFLVRPQAAAKPKSGDACGCGSGKRFRLCCETRPLALRPSWAEVSIRERNLILYRGIVNILGLEAGKDWIAVRRTLTDEQISQVYLLYETVWPLETDLLKLLPKPDGRARAVYTGYIHPETTVQFALGASLYFGELIIAHPFVHAGTLAKKYSPTENPRSYQLEFLKSVVFFLEVVPLVDAGLVNLIPNPCDFDEHLRDQMTHMAQDRSAGLIFDRELDSQIDQLIEREHKRALMMMPKEGLVARLRTASPELEADDIDELLNGIERLKEADPLIALSDDIFDAVNNSGQIQSVKLAPNFEMAMYLAQATGAVIVTDSPFRWRELCRASRPPHSPSVSHLTALAAAIRGTSFLFPCNTNEIAKLGYEGVLAAYPQVIKETYRYLTRITKRGIKPNWEAHIAARFARNHVGLQALLRKRKLEGTTGRITCIVPADGIQHNTINRLLLMSSSEHHLPGVPIAFYIEPVATAETPK